ncbi:MAG TPA: HEAT repeat domain-containing protein, partial [Pyrinomonadaceae bacterium]
SAIEQANDEYEEDEAVRELALKILAAFRNHNAIEALTQIALYDLSANLRSKAVGSLADYGHESVFEPILLACADPTREVRAAAARGLFSLGFDRAHAWKRIIEANDVFRLTQAARAAIASDIVSRSFERLINEDTKVAYEAFALVALLIKADETKEIFDAIETHKDERVRFALLHVLKVQKDERTIEELTRIALSLNRKPEMLAKVKDTMAAIQSGVQREAWQAS